MGPSKVLVVDLAPGLEATHVKAVSTTPGSHTVKPIRSVEI